MLYLLNADDYDNAMPELPFYTIKECSNYLGISEATVRNWLRNGILIKDRNDVNGIRIPAVDVEALKKGLDSEHISRLSSRANRSYSAKRFQPYKPQTAGKEKFDLYIRELSSLKLSLQEKIQAVAWLSFLRSGEDPGGRSIRPSVADLFAHVSSPVKEAVNGRLAEISPVEEPDLLGLVYQSLLAEGRKSETGSYFTPAATVEKIMDSLTIEEGYLLDPSCGSGIFLLEALKRGASPRKLIGLDVDPISVFCCKANLLLADAGDFHPLIYCSDFLLDSLPFSKPVHSIATNPPWGALRDKSDLERLRKKYTQVKSKETFTFFTCRMAEVLEAGGTAALLLPESSCYVKTHADFRKTVLDLFDIDSIEELGRPFGRVFSAAVRISLQKKSAGSSSESSLNDTFQSSPFHLFNYHKTDCDDQLRDKVFQFPRKDIKSESRWLLGVVSGDNNRFTSPTQKPGFIPVYRGRDLADFSLGKPRLYLKPEWESFQQSCGLEQYNAAPKILYRFISRIPVAALDYSGVVTLNSANGFCLDERGYPLEVLAALWNSRLFRHLFWKEFRTLKILRWQLEWLPVPAFSEDIMSSLIQMVSCFNTGNGYRHEDLYNGINDLINREFRLSTAQTRLISKEIYSKG